ncbi:hypothetical protein LOTGIDRAFT_236810 [Lottia gigantea]|uniref:Uncharacterized protein n=1 Tax=Lottia gigantea TaxID=225164 RepID=V3YYL0_LOTGI|nr:hypothetical protein LOTGIDRAFT_236810 [Lottia gigantea]ESO83233.1 hypothetical protein LOTGIDRAFT_236810 [Lottia gigantea]
MADKENPKAGSPSPSESNSQSPRRPTQKQDSAPERRDDSSDGRAEQNEFFRKELTRIEEGLKKEVSKIQKPLQKKHTPFIFNDLKPYYDTSSQRYLIETPEELQHCYSSRTTAIGLIDPWKNLEMDKSVLPVLEPKAVNRGETQKKKEKKIDERAKKTKHEGSTRLPKYPVVTLETSDLATKKLYYSDVPMLREELKQKYSANATKKIEEDYEKTKQDFYRMDLDKLNEVHPVNREHMRSTYFAYLQNTPGSKKAINECVKSIDKTEKAQ